MARALNSKPHKDYEENPNRTFSDMAGRLGLRVESTRPRKDGKRERVYSLNEDTRSLMLGYVFRNLGLSEEAVHHQISNLLRGKCTSDGGPQLREEGSKPPSAEQVSAVEPSPEPEEMASAAFNVKEELYKSIEVEGCWGVAGLGEDDGGDG